MTRAGPQQQQQQLNTDNIYVIVGRLLEATKAASEGIKTLSEESRANTTAIQANQAAINTDHNTLQAVDKIVRTGNGESLVTRFKVISEQFAEHVKTFEDEMEDFQDLRKRTEELERHKASHGTSLNTIWKIAMVTAWAVTTGIALYSALRGK